MANWNLGNWFSKSMITNQSEDMIAVQTFAFENIVNMWQSVLKFISMIISINTWSCEKRTCIMMCMVSEGVLGYRTLETMLHFFSMYLSLKHLKSRATKFAYKQNLQKCFFQQRLTNPLPGCWGQVKIFAGILSTSADFPFLVHLSHRLKVSHCHHPISIMRRVLSTIASNHISSETA